MGSSRDWIQTTAVTALSPNHWSTRELPYFIQFLSGNPLQYSCLENPMDWGLVGCGPWGRKESDTTEQLHFHFSLSRTGEGNGNPLQYSHLENPMDGGAWRVAVHGVAKSRTQLRDFTLTFHFHAWEKEMATHSSVLAWRIPGTEEPSGLPSMGLHRVGHDWSDLAAAAACIYYFSSYFAMQVTTVLSRIPCAE